MVQVEKRRWGGGWAWRIRRRGVRTYHAWGFSPRPNPCRVCDLYTIRTARFRSLERGRAAGRSASWPPEHTRRQPHPLTARMKAKPRRRR